MFLVNICILAVMNHNICQLRSINYLVNYKKYIKFYNLNDCILNSMEKRERNGAKSRRIIIVAETHNYTQKYEENTGHLLANVVLKQYSENMYSSHIISAECLRLVFVFWRNILHDYSLVFNRMARSTRVQPSFRQLSQLSKHRLEI